jgi:phosphonopyruvate decarboxylase
VKDEPQHEQMGRIMHGLLDTLEIPWLPFPQEESAIAPTMAKAEERMSATQRPFALVMEKDTIAPHELGANPQPTRLTTDLRENFRGQELLTRTEALELILETLNGDEAIIATTGKTGRELFTVADRPNHLYVVGGMGTASAIGFGVAHSLPKQPVVVIDGDGAALMKMGSLATVGFHQPENFLHIVLDNEAHDSTGGQQTASPVVRFAQVAAGANYRCAVGVDQRANIRDAVHELRQRPGPSLLHVKIRPGSPEKLGRPTVKPHDVKERFSAFLRENAR